MALTQKQRAFVEAKAKGASNKNAAIAAGYSADTASQAGSRLAKNEAIVAALARKNKKPAVKPAPATEAAAGPAAVSEKGSEDQIDSMLMTSDPKKFLTALMNDAGEDPKLRLEAAKALLPYVHGKVADAGKKEASKAAAQKAGTGKFGSAPPPLRLVR